MFVFYAYYFSMIYCNIAFIVILLLGIVVLFLTCRLIFLSILEYFQPSYTQTLSLPHISIAVLILASQIHKHPTLTHMPTYPLRYFLVFPMLFAHCGGVYNILLIYFSMHCKIYGKIYGQLSRWFYSGYERKFINKEHLNERGRNWVFLKVK